MNITIQVTGDKQVINRMKRLGPSLYLMRNSMYEIGEEASKYFANQGFNSQGGVFGNSWTPLSRKYGLRKAKKYPGKSPLVATGKMRDSFYFVAGSQQVLIGNRKDYYKYHQSTRARTIMPRRQTMGINDPIKKMVRSTIRKEVKAKLKEA